MKKKKTDIYDVIKQIPKIPMVRFDFENTPKKDHKYYEELRGRTFFLMGDIKQQKHHCVLIDVHTGKIEMFWHTDQFVELTEDEV